jgi:hypothetical protein
MPYKREDFIPLPSDRNHGIVNHVGDDVPIVFSGIPGRSVIKAVVRRSQRQQDRAFSVP